MPATRILIFDSGVGGFSIASAVHQQHPHLSLTYVADNALFPYGIRSEEELLARIPEVIAPVLQEESIDLIIMACNTASTVILPLLRERFTQPVIGVVPAIKPAAASSKSKVIGLLATTGTLSRGYTQKLINDFAADCQLVPLGSSELVALAEEKIQGKSVDAECIKQLLSPFIAHPEMDTLVMACTHFPLLEEELKQALPNVQHWINPGEAIARRVGFWLEELGLKEIELKETGSKEHKAHQQGMGHRIIFTRQKKQDHQAIEAWWNNMLLTNLVNKP